MGYRGKLQERAEARRRRAEGETLAAIAASLSVSKSSVSLWVRDVPFVPSQRRTGGRRRRHPAQERKDRQIKALNVAGIERLGVLGSQAYLAAGTALYAGEGSKADGLVRFSNTDPAMMRFFAGWLRATFPIDETRLRGYVYLHEGLDLDVAEQFWSHVMNVPRSQFGRAYSAAAGLDTSPQQTRTRLRVSELRVSRGAPSHHGTGARPAIVNSESGVVQLAERVTVNHVVGGSSPSPGALSSTAPAKRSEAARTSR